MNYDLHVGAIFGLPGRFLAFFASLIAASLPVTGFYIWGGKKRKKPADKQSMTMFSAEARMEVADISASP